MTTTRTSTSVPATAADRRTTLLTTGGAMWALSSGAWAAADLESQRFGSPAFVAVALSWWAFMVAAPLLVALGTGALRTALGEGAGRIGRIGLAMAAAGLVAMALGIGVEVAAMSVGGGEVALGHVVLLAGFLVGIAGSLLTGITVVRRRSDGLSRTAGWLLALALPLGIGVGALGSVLVPGNDAAFWAALTLPTGLAWFLLGRSLTAERHPHAAA